MLTLQQQLSLGILLFSKVNSLGAAAMLMSGRETLTWGMLGFSLVLVGLSVALGVTSKGVSSAV